MVYIIQCLFQKMDKLFVNAGLTAGIVLTVWIALALYYKNDQVKPKDDESKTE